MKEILTNKQYFLADESATIAVGEKLANIVKSQLNEGIVAHTALALGCTADYCLAAQLGALSCFMQLLLSAI